MAFEAVDNERAPSSDPLVVHLHAAMRKRLELFETCDALRLFDAASDGLTAPAELRHVTIERYADHAVLNLYDELAYERRERIAEAVMALGARSVFAKVRTRTDVRRMARDSIAPGQPLRGQEPAGEVVVGEHGMRFSVRLGDGLSTGLFIDQRDNREHVRQSCLDMRVLNLFAYTCSFSVAAGLGGAALVTSVDLSQQALERGNRNLQQNALPPGQHRLLRADCRKWLARAQRREERFDWIVLDPPVFASVKGQPFVVDRDYAALSTSCLQLLSSGGRLLAVLNHQKTSDDDFEALLRQAASAARRRIASFERRAAPPDCASVGPAVTKSAILTAE